MYTLKIFTKYNIDNKRARQTNERDKQTSETNKRARQTNERDKQTSETNKRARQTNERDTFSHNTPPSHSSFNYSIKKMISTSNKHQLQLVLQTFEKKPQLSIHKA